MEYKQAAEEARKEAENVIQFIDGITKRMAEPPEPPEGWYGGEVWQSGGLVFIREWINPEKGIGIAYGVTDLDIMVGHADLLAEDADPSDPHSYTIHGSIPIEDIRLNAESDEEALTIAQSVMEGINDDKIVINGE